MYSILIADDESDIIELLKLYLEHEGWTILSAQDGLHAWSILESKTVDLAILDVMMPKLDGFSLLKRIRQNMKIPVIMLSAKSEDQDKILGLGLGADDYIAKPFNPLEVVARVHAQLRRFKMNAQEQDNDQTILSIGPFELNQESCIFLKHGSVISLTSTEYKILKLLMSHPGKVFTRAQIFETIWSEWSDGDDNTIMVHMRKIREKIEDDPSHPEYVTTIRGLGYRFEHQVKP